MSKIIWRLWCYLYDDLRQEDGSYEQGLSNLVFSDYDNLQAALEAAPRQLKNHWRIDDDRLIAQDCSYEQYKLQCIEQDD